MEKFTYVGSISKDHIDPSVFCVLTAKSKQPGVPLADFLIFGGRWDVSDNTFRPPVSPYLRHKSIFISDLDKMQYYHRNSATEFMGLIYGPYGGRSDGFQPGKKAVVLHCQNLLNGSSLIGGASFENGFCPHGGALFRDIL